MPVFLPIAILGLTYEIRERETVLNGANISSFMTVAAIMRRKQTKAFGSVPYMDDSIDDGLLEPFVS